MTQQQIKKRIVLGITGSIAAYKAAELCRLYVTRGYEVRVVMTQSAQRFITPITMQALSGQPVSTEFWNESEQHGIGHIQLADWADVLVVAPATADFIAKAVNGFAESPLLAIALATKAPLVLAPAMNVNMLTHVQTQENIKKLQARGVQIVEPEEGALACGWNGSGRLAHIEEIFAVTQKALTKQDFAGCRVLITTGPTREAVDPVRFLTNRSSGKMGVALAHEAYRRGADVVLVHGPVSVSVPHAVRCFPVTSAVEMHQAVSQEIKTNSIDVVIMAAAVADYRPEQAADQKLKKHGQNLVLSLQQNPDILASVGAGRSATGKPILVGFAVETGDTENLLSEARRKLETKNADLIVANFAVDAFDRDTNRVWIVDKQGRQEEIATARKSAIAETILDAVARLT